MDNVMHKYLPVQSKIKLFAGFLICILLLQSVNTFAQTAADIVRKSDEKMRGLSSYSEMSMQIIRPHWTRSMSMKAWTKGNDNSLILVTEPAQGQRQQLTETRQGDVELGPKD